MCDLIDLNSPDRKSSLSSRLASPLIPIPTDTICNNYNIRTNELNSLMIGKRDSLENNPFDMVLHKTTEYIQKKDDPFEMTLEKAMRIQCKNNTSFRTSSFDLTDNYVHKQKMHKQKLKINKTLDDSLINDELNQNNVATNKISNESITVDSSNTNALKDDLKSDSVIPTIDVQYIDLSILHQSVMNDTLFEVDNKSYKNQIKSTLQDKMLIHTEEDKISFEQFPLPDTTLKIPKLRRSLSQGEALSPKKSQYLNQISLGTLRIGSNSRSIKSSSNSTDMLNEGFIKNHSNESSIFSSLSNISSIPKLNSVSSISIDSSIMLSNGTINRTFLESCSSEKSENTKSSENIVLNKEKSILPAAKDVTSTVINISTKTSMSDLTDQFKKLKARISEIHVPESSININNELTCNSSNGIKECVTVMEKNSVCGINSKLIDVDVFTPENNCNKENSKSSFSDISSDSVFVEGNKINKSILQEAKVLARTFEELALRTSSESSIDDLITNNPSWTLELLPAFDDEASVENLIELPKSPDGTDTKSKDVKVTENKDNDEKDEFNNKVKENVKNLEMELVEPVSTEKRLTAITLLLDLKKLIETESNTEANKLLENLEKALGINCENNTELLTTCLNITNNLAKSPQKSSSNLEIIKNVAENNMEHSQEDNLIGDSTESIKESVFIKNVNFNNVNTNKCIHNQKHLNDVNNKCECKCEILKTEAGTNINNEKDENKINVPEISEEDSSSKQKNNSLTNEKAVVELLANIGKLLCEQTKGHSTLNILENLGQVLNFASNNCNLANDRKTESVCIRNQQTPRKSKLKLENKTHSSYLSKSSSRLSLNVESKKQPVSKNFIRRSVSVSQTPPVKNESNSLISTSKSTSQLNEVTKRFPSDPSFIRSTSNKKIITSNSKNLLQKDAEITKTTTALDLRKEKSSIISTVKNKLKKKIDINVTNKKGPMKAVLPVGNMQKRETVNTKIISSTDTITPPQSHKIISSTPNSTNNGLPIKQSRSSKPVASSTPDTQNSKMRKIQSQIISSPKKRNFSCDISPVTTRVNVNSNNRTNNSPRRSNKLPSPKKTTPKRRPIESGIPKSQTPPISKRLNSSFEVKNENNTQQSPLRENNKLVYKVKPMNLISKLRRHSIGTNVIDKENAYI
ncbi:PREDICTED: protein PF14_0175-like [Eufriesea mexicana]|uniref:protein PF14_0175-like n=1 Tax=Eufriesea mexicana TaxID=516756 RepID=UPI00083C386C|nr:PREDICTED: protein PF14_0175-like [Eufriesea mexicana]